MHCSAACLSMVWLATVACSTSSSTNAGDAADGGAPDASEPLDAAVAASDAQPDSGPIEAAPPRDADQDTGPLVDAATDARPDASDDAGPIDAAVDRVISEGGLTLSFGDCVQSAIGSVALTVSGVAVAAADLDGDGKDDLAVSSWEDSHLVTLQGAGDGSFRVVSTKTVGNSPRDVCLADLNRDGRLDVVTSNLLASNVGVLLGGAGCSVSDPVLYAGPRSLHLAAGDINADGNVDLVVGNTAGTPNLGVFFGDGAGALSTVSYVTARNEPASPVVADFNRDGKLDVAVTVPSFPAPVFSGGIVVLLGRGDGTFAAPVDYPTYNSPFRSVVGDFTLDGLLDLITIHSGTSMVSLLVGNGDGTFQPASMASMGDGSTIAAADFDRDGVPDLAVTAGGNAFAIYRGRGDGTFPDAQSFHITAPSGRLAAAELNGDGLPDLVVATVDAFGAGLICGLINTSQ